MTYSLLYSCFQRWLVCRKTSYSVCFPNRKGSSVRWDTILMFMFYEILVSHQIRSYLRAQDIKVFQCKVWTSYAFHCLKEMTTNIDDGQDLARQTQEDQDNDDRTFGSYFRTIRCTEPYPSRFIASFHFHWHCQNHTWHYAPLICISTQGRMHARDGLLHAWGPDGDGGRRRRRLRWWALPFPRPHPQVWLLGLKSWHT